MKELLIEEKAKRYDLAIDAARCIYNNMKEGGDFGGMEDLEVLFPELKESEDEKLREQVVYAINQLHVCECTKNKLIAWLEKQDEKKEINLIEILKHYPRETELYSPLYGKLWLAEVDEKNEIITCYKYPLDEGDTRAILEQEDTVSFYSDGTTGLPDYTISKNCMLFLYDIEKQGEQKPVVTPKFRIGDIITPKGKKEYYTIIDIVDGWYEFREKHINGGIPIYYQFGWELVEQKPTDKVEPKFKVGDWVVNNNGEPQFSKVIAHPWPNSFDSKIKRAENNLEIFLNTATLDKQYHLWTIQDAKDGDVLVVDNVIFMYKRALANHIVSYCRLIDDIFESTSDARTCCEGNTYVHPATKEQRDLLFNKMHEAGYEWDADKKELKKIEQKPDAWGEEDECTLNGILADYKSMCKTYRNWLESLKNRIQPKQEWSEEDEEIIKNIIAALNKLSENILSYEPLYQKEINWLKYLKDRYTWKPSDRELGAMLAAIGDERQKGSDVAKELQKIYQHLKKLREK